MAATRLRMPRPVECARRSTVWNGCLEKVKRSAAGPPSTLPQMSRLPRQRTPQRTSLPNSGHESRHGRQSGPLRPLRRKDSPHRRPPSLPSKRREPISKGNPPLPLNRPPKLGRWLCGNRGGSRPGIWYSGPILHIRSACASDISRTYRSRKGPVRIKGRSTPSARRGKDRGAHLQADHQDGGSGG